MILPPAEGEGTSKGLPGRYIATYGRYISPASRIAPSSRQRPIRPAWYRSNDRDYPAGGNRVPWGRPNAFYHHACKPTETNKISTQGVLDSAISPKRLADKLRKLFRKQVPAEVEAEGVFHSEGGPFGADVARFRIVIQHLTSVQKLAKGASGKGP